MAETQEEYHEALEKRHEALAWWEKLFHVQRKLIARNAMEKGIVVERDIKNGSGFTGREIENIHDHFKDGGLKVKAIFGTIEFIERDGKDYAEIHCGPKIPFYERELKGSYEKIMDDAEILMQELGVDSFVIPDLYEGKIIYMQKPKYPIYIF